MQHVVDRLSLALGIVTALLVAAMVALLALLPRQREDRSVRAEHVQRALPSVDVTGHVTTSRERPGPPDRPYVPTRARADFHQVGFVHGDSLRAPLYGRPAPRNPSRWQYYVAVDDDIRVAVRSGALACMGDVGCPELSSGDAVQVPELTAGDVAVTVYDRL